MKPRFATWLQLPVVAVFICSCADGKQTGGRPGPAPAPETSAPRPVAPAPPRADTGNSGDSRMGRSITITGTAANAFLGAVVLDGEDNPYYIAGLEEWDDRHLDHRVEVTGVLAEKKLAPDPVVADDGAVSHGMHGTSLVLDNATWKLAP